MARRTRQKSATGIYHVMLRGINKQDIFLDKNDFESMVSALNEARLTRSHDKKVLSEDCCTIYAYCILHNHLHLLVREGTLNISEIMKKIQDRFVFIYNRKYERVGHLFQDRFVSEPVQEFKYFKQLIRYIHRNPVKALEAERPEDYPYSSWREYIASRWVIKGSDPLITRVCDVRTVIRRIGYDELVEWVNMDVDDRCMDMDTFIPPMSDIEAWERLQEMSGVASVEDFKQLSPDEQVRHIAMLIDDGASLRQASRLSSLSYKALWNRLNPEEYQAQLELRKMERMNKRNVGNQGV